jgi:hypothetical protein
MLEEGKALDLGELLPVVTNIQEAAARRAGDLGFLDRVPGAASRIHALLISRIVHRGRAYE